MEELGTAVVGGETTRSRRGHRIVETVEEIHSCHIVGYDAGDGEHQIDTPDPFCRSGESGMQLGLDRTRSLGENIIQAFTALHKQGFAASVEVWDNETDELVGGLYGVTIGKVFIGESMFSRVPSASKIALIFLARYLQEHGGKMIDCQLETPHLKSMGGRYISYEEYMKIMNEE